MIALAIGIANIMPYRGASPNYPLTDEELAVSTMYRVRGYLFILLMMVCSQTVFADDYGDDCSHATTISSSSVTGGVLDTNTDNDYFRLDLTQGGTLTIRSEGTIDTVGYLLDAACNQIAYNDDGGSGLNFFIERTVAPGTYYIRVRGYSGSTGAYTLNVSFTGSMSTDDDHGDSCSTATPVGVNSSTPGVINIAGDNDYFRFELNETSTVTIYTDGSTDTYGTLYDSTCSQITSNDDSGAGLNFQITRTLSAGVYYVKVRHFSSGTGSYTLHISTSGAGDDHSNRDDHSNSCTGATPLPLNTSIAGVIETAGDSDYFRLDVPSRMHVTVGTQGSTDTYGVGLTSSCTPTRYRDDDSGTGLNFLMSGTIPPGTYYLQVRHYSSTGTGPYTLSFTSP